ncbi:MAG: S8 family serine peptidase [Bacteroidota bacterium]
MSIAHRILLMMLLGTVIGLGFAKQNKNNSTKERYEPGVLVIKLKQVSTAQEQIDHAAAFSYIQSKYNASKPERVFTTNPGKKMLGEDDLERIYTIQVSTPTDLEVLAQKIALEPQIEFAEPNYYFPLNVIPNDPLYNQIYPLAIVKADTAWEIQKGDSTVLIGIIDSGVDWDHPDLASVIWNNADEIQGNGIDDDGNGYIDDTRGWDFVANVSDAISGEDGTTEDNNPMDFDGHGTHVSGIAAGATNNGVGISSLGWGCRIMPLRCGWHSTDGNGYVSSLYASKAYKYAADNGAAVCNQSSGTSEVVLEGARYAFKNGVVIVNSAGNSNSDFAGLLGAEPWALSVAATNSNDNRASYSSYNAKVDISAPGGDFSSGNRKGFLSTVVHPSSFFSNQQYVEFQGTSMASPFVAALAGLVKSKNKSWSPAQVMFQITGTADNIDAKNPSYVGKLGYGRINAYRALTETPAPPKPNLEFVSFSIDDAVGGNGNGVLEAGESATLKVIIRNDWGDAQNLTAVLSSNHWSVSIPKSSSNYGLLRGISNLDSAQRGSLNDDFTISLSSDAIPQIIPFTVQFSASGGFSKQFSFEIALGSRILLVDDDDGTVNVEGYYTSALNKLGTVYDVWDHTKKGSPTAGVLQKYQSVIWLCEWTFPSLDSADRAAISDYLNSGGRLFLSGQDIGWDLADATGSEFLASGGSSKTFFETYLKAKYVSDDAAFSNLNGVAQDSIGDALVITRTQPDRAASEQYPDVVDTVGGSIYSFKYSGGTFNNRGGAVKYAGMYKLLYFAFGGFESITESAKREIVMERILKWLFEYDMVVDKRKNTENKVNPYPVSAAINSKSTLQSVDLYWDNDGSFPYKKIAMTLSGDKYTASIPAQSVDGIIEYFVLAKNSGGYLPFLSHSFYVGPDTVKPTISVGDTIGNSIKVTGPYSMSVAVSDDIDVDTTSVQIKYMVNNSGVEQTAPMTKFSASSYLGSIVPSSALTSGDIINYYIVASDNSAAKNTARYPVTGTKQFTIGKEVIDNFENPLSGKWNLGLWAYTDKQKKSGLYSITDSPDSNYQPNSERILSLKTNMDLSPFSSATVKYDRKFVIDVSDTLYFEVSPDGTNWTSLKKLNGASLFWGTDVLSLNSFTGAGNSSVSIRFRLKADATNENKDGAYIDNIEIFTNNFTVNVPNDLATVPVVFALEQNYPNPFNPVTVIQYSIPSVSFVTLKIFDTIGREVGSPVSELKEPGTYRIHVDASHLASGVYYYKLSAGSFTSVKKMLIVK